MNLLIWLHATLGFMSESVEGLRVLVEDRIYQRTHNEKPPLHWRKSEKLPPSGHFPSGGWVKGAVKVGPVRPVPSKLDVDQ